MLAKGVMYANALPRHSRDELTATSSLAHELMSASLSPLRDICMTRILHRHVCGVKTAAKSASRREEDTLIPSAMSRREDGLEHESLV